MTAYLIDTDVAVHLRDGTPTVVRFLTRIVGRPSLSLMSLVELEGGIAAVPELAARRRASLDRLLAAVTLLPVERNTVDAYAAIVAATGYSRRRVIDRLIAATAIANDLTLATINGDDFRDIPGLRLDVWPSPDQ